jgi:F0F1-type ATP synthase assembly protein I
MSTIDVSGARRAALMLVLAQVAATLILAVAFLVGSSARAAISALIGGGIGVAASLAMVFFMFRGAATDPRGVLRSAYRGEAAKFGITVLLIVAALKNVELAVLPFFVTYAATLLVYWIALVKAPAG